MMVMMGIEFVGLSWPTRLLQQEKILNMSPFTGNISFEVLVNSESVIGDKTWIKTFPPNLGILMTFIDFVRLF